MKKKLLLLTFLLPVSVFATPDWSTGVAPILFNHCATCHHDGSIAPFALMTYNDAVANAYQTGANVSAKIMPPWPPDPNYSHLAHERLLTAAEITTITDWISGGMPEGDVSLAPPTPVFPVGGDIPGTPDFVGTIPTFTSTATTSDVYQCFVIPSGTSVDKFITGFEALPGNRNIVHHVLVYADTTSNHTCRHLDTLDPGPGYVNFGGVGSSSAILLGGWVPGSAPSIYPANFGVRLPAGADIVLQIHYPKGTAGMKDSTQVHFFFSPVPVRDVFIIPVLNHQTNITPTLDIAPNTTQWYSESQLNPLDLSLIGIAPHMHLIGKNIEAFGITPAQDTQKYISVPKWDFHWQGFYMMHQIMKISSLTTLKARAYYDNTGANDENPNIPPLEVTAGENTTNEMMLVFFVVAQYQTGDENIVIDTAAPTGIYGTYYHGQQLLDPYPNPTGSKLVVKCNFDNADHASIDLLDINGKVVRQLMQDKAISAGYSTFPYSLDGVPAGDYVLRMNTSERSLTRKIVVTR